MNKVYTICTDAGDEYKLQFTSERSGAIAEEIIEIINNKGIEVVEIGLGRIKGQNVTSLKVLAQIEQCIAEIIIDNPNVILTFFCDFISLLPSTKKTMSVQEYRSRLFSRMFDRYVSQHSINNIYNKVIKVEGVAEDYYFHVIGNKEYIDYANIIGEGIQQDFGK